MGLGMDEVVRENEGWCVSVCVCELKGGILLTCFLIGLFKRWGRGSHKPYSHQL